MRKLTLFFAVFLIGTNCWSQSASDILEKMDQLLLAPKDKQGDLKMTLKSKSGKDKVREAILYQKGPDKRLTVYTQPESQAGISTLSLPDGVMWLYMPALGGPKRISILAKSQAFNNTDFSFEDMDRSPYTERFSANLIKSSSEGHVLELVPKYEKSSYSKLVITIHSTNYHPNNIEYYDRSGNKFKEAVYTFEKIGPYWNASKITMTNLKKQHSTIIEVSNVKFDQGLEDSLFLVENLRPPKK